MAQAPGDRTDAREGFLKRSCRWLTSPSAKWSVLALAGTGLVIGAAGVILTQVMVAATGTNEFCGGACHSMQWVYAEYKQSAHYVNRTGVRAECHDCHIPHDYPRLLWYKAKAGVKDVIGEMRGTISTQEKFEKERLRMAQHVWDEYKENKAENCRTCHQFTADIVKKQKEMVQPMHQAVLEGAAVCTDCHKGIAHTAPKE